MRKIPTVKPATIENPLAWYAGTSDEFMNIAGPLATRDEAIAAGRDHQAGDPFYICQAAPYGWRAPDADSVMDEWINDHDELWWEDGFDGFVGKNGEEVIAVDDLQTVLNEWFLRHRAMLPTATAFCIERDGEWIDGTDQPA